LPEEPRVAKILGLYPQRQEGLWLQRVRIPGGRLSADQWRALAALARELTPATPLHLTTRQDVEIHDLGADAVPVTQQRLAAAGLTTVGGGGDTARNITVCPCSGTPGRPDLSPLAAQIQGVLDAYAGLFTLPRKFKISLSACPEACGRPWINDLGLVAAEKAGRWGFQVIAAGSLGARPGAGIVAFDWLAADSVLPLVHAAVHLFDVHGDRENRGKARLRHIRERLGDRPFLDLLNREFDAAVGARAWPTASLPIVPDGVSARRVLTFPNGDVTLEQAKALAVLAGQADMQVRISLHHRVLLFGPSLERLDAAVRDLPVLRAAAETQPLVVACPGTRWCKRALVDTNSLANRLRTELAAKLPHVQTICISGCPNGCAHSAVAPVGLIGAASREGDEVREAFRLLTGGGLGCNEKLAQPAGGPMSADEVVARVAAILTS
jgi:sulfite reductase (ferredoxin)